MKINIKQSLLIITTLLATQSSLALSEMSLAEIKKTLSEQEYKQYTHDLWQKDRKKADVTDYSQLLYNENGNTLTVGPGDNCGFPNIPTAINFAADGATIMVAATTYTQLDAKIQIQNNLTLIGGLDDNCQVFTIERTKLQLNTSGPAVEINVSGGKTVLLSGFDISNTQEDAIHDYNSAIHVFGDGNVTISNSHLHDNNAFDGGGLSVINGATVILNENTEIYANTAHRFGGGIFCGNSFIYAYDVKIGRFINETTQGNTAMDTDGAGGGIYASNCELTLGDTIFGNGVVEINYNNGDGGAGIYSFNSIINMGYLGSRISFNIATNLHQGVATALFSEGNSTIILSDLEITDNGNAAVIQTRDTTNVMISSNCANKPCSTIARNKGIYTRLIDDSTMKISDTLLSDGSFNTSIFVTSQAMLDIENSIIAHTNSTFQPAFISTAVNGIVNMTNTTIANNSYTEDDSNLFRTIGPNSQINFNGGIIWGNTFSHFTHDDGSGITIANSIIQYDPTGMSNTLQADPLFVSNTNFHIRSGSPAIDHFNSDLTTDFEGDFRPQGIQDDAGADEWKDLIFKQGFDT